MSDTLDEIEYRLSPEHMKREAKDFFYETVDEVRERFHPQRIARRAGTNMKNTVSEHPVPSLIAGLSIGYLLMKSGEKRTRRRSYPHDEQFTYRPTARRARVRADHPGSAYYREAQGRSVARPPRGDYPRETRRGDHESSGRKQARSTAEQAAEKAEETKERAREQAGEVKERATQQAREMTERASEWAEEAGRQARTAQHRVERGARQAQGQVRNFVNRNPLMAGAVAVGVGAFLGGMFPSTRTEDEWMGETRDDVMHRAERATEETMHRAQEAAESVAGEAESATQNVAETTKEEAQRVTEKAKEEGENVKEEAKQQAKEQSQKKSNS